jgi:hypothetical protein
MTYKWRNCRALLGPDRDGHLVQRSGLVAQLTRNPLQNMSIDGDGAPGFNALFTGTAHRPQSSWGNMEASLLYAPTVIMRLRHRHGGRSAGWSYRTRQLV